MRWLGHFDDGTVGDIAPGIPFDPTALVAITCEDQRISIPEGSHVQRLERTSVGGTTWRVGIVAVDEELHIIPEGGGRCIRQTGWGTDVLTGRPA